MPSEQIGGYTPPTPSEVHAIKQALGLKGSEIATLVSMYGGQSVRKWISGKSNTSFAQLYTLLHRAESIEITPEDWREELVDLLDGYSEALAEGRHLEK